MRAVCLPELMGGGIHLVTGEAQHHLANVVRVRVDDELLLLDGKGLVIRGLVEAVSRKEVRIRELQRELCRPSQQMDLALGIPKREALELSLKEAVELGFRRIFLVRGEHSQQKVPEPERLQKLLVSALEQSNSPFLPEVVDASWREIPWSDFGLKLLLDSQTKESTREVVDLTKPTLLVVGPEGGFSSAELLYLHERPGLEILNLPTPILRTPTAVATGAGCLLQRLMDRR